MHQIVTISSFVHIHLFAEFMTLVVQRT